MALIAVTGATGQQGGGVVTALLKKGFKVRALTRDLSSEKAKALAARSPDIQLAKAELTDKASLVKAFEGVDGIFLVTDVFTAKSFDGEVAQGTAAVAAAQEAKVPFVVFSTLEDTREALKDTGLSEAAPGHWVPHFDAKALVAEELKASGIPHANLLTAGFYENTINFYPFQKQEDGTITWSDNLGSSEVAWHAVGDIGESAAVIFEDPQKYSGKTIPVVGELLTPGHVASVLSKLSGRTVKYHQVSDETYKSFPFPMAADMGSMFAYYRLRPEVRELRPLSQRIFEGPTFEEWANRAPNREALHKRLTSL